MHILIISLSSNYNLFTVFLANQQLIGLTAKHLLNDLFVFFFVQDGFLNPPLSKACNLTERSFRQKKQRKQWKKSKRILVHTGEGNLNWKKKQKVLCV